MLNVFLLIRHFYEFLFRRFLVSARSLNELYSFLFMIREAFVYLTFGPPETSLTLTSGANSFGALMLAHFGK